MKFGRLAARLDHRTLRFEKYTLPSLPPIPDTVDNIQTVYKAFGYSDASLVFPMDGNDSLGDCTIAAVAHAITLYRGLIGTQSVPLASDVEAAYYKLGSGQDNGLVELDVLNEWRKNGLLGEQILAYVAVDSKKHDHVKSAIQLFGGVYIGFQVQDGCVTDFRNGTPWVPAYLTNEGHAVFVPGYDSGLITALTWGGVAQGTWDWWDECVDECYAILPPEAKEPGFCPGFNIAQLTIDLMEVTG